MKHCKSCLPTALSFVALLSAAAPVSCGSAPAEGAGGAGGSAGTGAGASAGAGEGGTAGAGANSASGGSAGAGAGLLSQVDNLCTFVLLGASDAAGYYATGLNAPGGNGYARLVTTNNDADYPGWHGHDLATLYPGVEFVDLAESGFTSAQMLSKLKSNIGSIGVGAPGCDTWVHIGDPGNDFNDNVLTIVDPSRTKAAASEARANLQQMVQITRHRFDDPADGHTMILTFSTVQDPTDGTGDVPQQYNDKFCQTIHNPLFTAQLRQTAVQNLAYFNGQIAAEAQADGAVVLDQHQVLFGHGMPSSEPWFVGDCTHPNDKGHHAIRRGAWKLLTGETLPL